jgi:hypothetical protein
MESCDTRTRVLLGPNSREVTLFLDSPPRPHPYVDLHYQCVKRQNGNLRLGTFSGNRMLVAGQHQYATLFTLCARQPASKRYEIRSKKSKVLEYTVAVDQWGKYFYDLSGELKYVFWSGLGATYTAKGDFVMAGSIEGELDGSNAELAQAYG